MHARAKKRRSSPHLTRRWALLAQNLGQKLVYLLRLQDPVAVTDLLVKAAMIGVRHRYEFG